MTNGQVLYLNEHQPSAVYKKLGDNWNQDSSK